MPVYDKRDYEWMCDAVRTDRDEIRGDRLTGADLRLYAQRIMVLMTEKYGTESRGLEMAVKVCDWCHRVYPSSMETWLTVDTGKVFCCHEHLILWNMARSSGGYGLAVGIIRDILVEKGMLEPFSQKIAEAVSSRLDATGCEWFETFSGKTFKISK
jgi:hypothetical protein